MRNRVLQVGYSNRSEFLFSIQLTPDNSKPRKLKPRANSNQSRFPLDFLVTFTVILPSVTRMLNNSNLLLTWSKFCFPSDHFYTILPSITWTMLKAHDKSGKKPCTEVRNIEFISKQPSQFFVFTILSLQFKFSVHPCIFCCLIAFPPNPFTYFPTSGYLLQTADNLNSR